MIRIKLFPIFFTLVFGLAVFSFADKSTSAQIKKDQAPSFALKLLNGKDFDSSELKGKPAVLKFVSSY